MPSHAHDLRVSNIEIAVGEALTGAIACLSSGSAMRSQRRAFEGDLAIFGMAKRKRKLAAFIGLRTPTAKRLEKMAP